MCLQNMILSQKQLRCAQQTSDKVSPEPEYLVGQPSAAVTAARLSSTASEFNTNLLSGLLQPKPEVLHRTDDRSVQFILLLFSVAYSTTIADTLNTPNVLTILATLAILASKLSISIN